MYSSLASIGRTGLPASTWCSMLLFFVSMRKWLACMRLSTTREVTRGSIIMSDDLLSSGQCEDPPGRIRCRSISTVEGSGATCTRIFFDFFLKQVIFLWSS